MNSSQSAALDAPDTTPAVPTSTLRGNVALVVLVVVLAAIKGRSFFPDGRMWAEEGRNYFPGLAGHSPLDVFTFLYHGYLALPTNLIVWTASLAPLRWMPALVSYPSLVAQLIPVFMVIASRRYLGIHLLALAGWIVIYFGVPQGAEVYATAVNLHLHLAFLVTVVLLLATDRHRWWMRGLMFVSGLGGIPANLMLPLFVLKALRSGDRERWVQTGILIATASFQAVLLLTHPGQTGPRHLEWNPWLMVLGSGAQQVIAPLLGVASGEGLAVMARSALHFSGPAVPLALLLAVVVCWLYAVILTRGDEHVRYMLGASLISIGVACVATLGDQDLLVSTQMHGRYFLVPNALLFLSVASLMSRAKAGALAVFFCACVISTGWFGVPGMFTGMPWREAYQACLASPPCTHIEIWPHGWVLPVPAGTSRNESAAAPPNVTGCPYRFS